MNKAVFLDRDGVLNKAVIKNKIIGSPKNLKELRLTPFIKKILKNIKKKKYLLIMVTNQPDYIRNKNTKKNILDINKYLKKKLNLDDVYCCFHDDNNNCKCRKPKIGLLLEAMKKYKINFKKSYFIGDRWRDIDCGNKVKCKTVLIDYNYNEKLNKKPNYRIKKLTQLLDIIK